MIACTETITIIKHTADTDKDLYTCAVVTESSWYAKTVISTSGDGAKPANTFDVRVFGALSISPAVGDYVARGIVKSITKPADLKSVEHFRITSVGDNRRGSLPHWRLSG